MFRKGEIMTVNGRVRGRLWPRLAAAAFLPLVLTGCMAGPVPPPAYMRPQSLYVKEQPCRRLYVEVDAVEGAEVPQRWLEGLKTFLAGHCVKPDGIEIVRDPPIPASEVEGMPFAFPALCACDGPRPADGPPPAYLHVFFQREPIRIADKKILSGVDFHCPSAIFYSTGYLHEWNDRIAVACLRHEAGHVLGLCLNRDHGDGRHHCVRRGCLMRPSPDLLSNFGLFLGISWTPSLCDDCGRDLQAARSEGVDDRLSFAGPFLVRRENGYSVVSVPGWHAIVVGPVEEVFDWRTALADMKTVVRDRRDRVAREKPDTTKVNPWCFHVVHAPRNGKGGFADVPQVVAALEKAREDPCPMVGHVASVRLKEFRKEADDEFKELDAADTASPGGEVPGMD